MPRAPRYATDLELLNAVREHLSADPDISQGELRSRIGGTQAVVSAAMRAVLVELGRLKLEHAGELDPRFVGLIRLPQPQAPLDLRFAAPEELAGRVTEHLAGVTEAIQRVISSVHKAALAAMDREHEMAATMIESADRRAARAEAFVEGLRREVAEAIGETERVRAQAAREHGQQALEIARLTRELDDARATSARAAAAELAAIAERDATKVALATAHEELVGNARELAVSNARVKELERHVDDLGTRLSRAEGEVAAARTAEADARAAAAGAVAKYEAREAMIRDAKRGPAALRGSKLRSE